MMFYEIKLSKNKTTIAKKVKPAITFKDRLIGLMFKNEMIGYDGLLLEPCKSIHNFFVRFPIDVIFLTKDNHVVKIIRSFKPWHMTGFYFKAQKVLELKEGMLTEDISIGDKIEVISV